MGTDFQRTVLWVFFGMSLFLLWDRWLVHTGKPSMFGTTPTPPPATAPAEAAEGRRATDRPTAPAASGAVPAAPPPAAASAAAGAPGAVPAQGPRAEAAAKAPPVVVQTDLLKVTIDPEGAVVSRAELLKEKVAPDWTASGLLGLVTGKKHDADRHTVLLEVSPSRVYVTQSGVVGGSFPNHRTPFTARRRAARTRGRPGHAGGAIRVRWRRRARDQDLHVPPRPLRHRRDARGRQHRRGAAHAVAVPADPARRQQARRRVVALLHLHRPGRVHRAGEVQEGRVLGDREEQARAAEGRRQRLGRHDPALLRHRVGAGEGRAPVLCAQRRQEPVLDRHAAAARHGGARSGGDREGDAVHRSAEPADAGRDRAGAGPRRRLRLADLPREADLLAAGVPAPASSATGAGRSCC